MGFSFRGVDFRSADAAERARVREELERVTYPQYVRLFTCNRSEIYFWDGDPTPSDAALTHLFRVAAGLASMVLGEYQILGQVKDAYRAALAAGTVGKELDRIFRDALTCAKRVKTELDLGAVSPSVCRAGLDLVEAREGLAGKRVFVIGSGKTGTLAVRLAAEKGAAAIAACNRSAERAAHLARDYGATIVDYADRYAQIAQSDVVISATASPHVVVERARLAAARQAAARGTARCFFLDLAAPRDVEPSVADLPGATVLALDDIGALVQGDRDERAALLAAGDRLVNEAVAKTSAWLAAMDGATGM